MSVTEWVLVIGLIPTVCGFVGGAVWGVRKAVRERDEEIRQKALADFRSEQLIREADSTIAQKNVELTAVQSALAIEVSTVKRLTETDIPRLQRRIDDLSEMLLNLSREQASP